MNFTPSFDIGALYFSRGNRGKVVDPGQVATILAQGAAADAADPACDDPFERSAAVEEKTAINAAQIAPLT